MAGGEVFSLDLHEAYHGCHGLVAGTTGSGKSEFLQAFILSLAINYSPKEVAFVLVDSRAEIWQDRSWLNRSLLHCRICQQQFQICREIFSIVHWFRWKQR